MGKEKKKAKPKGKANPRLNSGKRRIAGKIHMNSKYDDSLPVKLIKYFNVKLTSKTGVRMVDGEEISGATEGVDLPTFSGFRFKYKIPKTTYTRYITEKDAETGEPKYPEMHFAHMLCKDSQFHVMSNNGLKGRYNSSIVKVLLQNLHGMEDKASLKSAQVEVSEDKAEEIYKSIIESRQ